MVNGSYKLIPANQSSSISPLSLKTGTSNNGTLVGLGSSNGSQNLWSFERIIPITVRVLYDRAYAQRFPNTVEKLKSLWAPVQQKYLNSFKIKIKLEFMQVQSYAEQKGCPSAWNYNTPCTCNVGIKEHHTDIDKIYYNIPKADTSKCFNVYITGQVMCRIATEKNSAGEKVELDYCNPARFLGLALPERVLILCIQDSTTNYSDALVSEVIAHEVGHVFDASDHYGGDGPITDPEIGQHVKCIWGERNGDSDVMSELKMCTSCTREINEGKIKYFHK